MSDYLDGTDLLSSPPPHSGVVIGGATAWDNHNSYDYGNYVYHEGKYYRASRRVEAPWLPVFSSGEVPGESDAWREVSMQEAIGEQIVVDLEQGSDGVFEIGEAVGYDIDTEVRNWFPWSKLATPPQTPHFDNPYAPAKVSAREAANLSTAETRQVAAEKALRDYQTQRMAMAAALPATSSPAVVEYAIGTDVLDEVDCESRDEVLPDNVLGELEAIGALFDITTAQRNMNELKPVTVDIARAMLKGGQAAIAGAIAGAKQPWYKADLPGETSRKNVQDHLKWHEDVLKKIWGQGDKAYGSGEDLKKWTMQSYIEWNAVEAGSEHMSKAWNDMWDEIQKGLAAIPREIVKTAAGAASGLVEAVTGVPLWVWAVGGVIVCVGLGFVVWKLVTSRAGVAVAGVAARKYLP